jgi:hypothetical protein
VFLQSDFQNKAESLSIRIRQNHFRFIVHRRIKWIVGDCFVQNKDYTFPANRKLRILPRHQINSNDAFVRVAEKHTSGLNRKYIKIDFMFRTIGKRPKHTNYACAVPQQNYGQLSDF